MMKTGDIVRENCTYHHFENGNCVVCGFSEKYFNYINQYRPNNPHKKCISHNHDKNGKITVNFGEII